MLSPDIEWRRTGKRIRLITMRVLIQRVIEASVTIDGAVRSSIGNGLLVLVGVEEADTQEDVEWLVQKVTALRIFNDENGVMNISVMESGGQILAVSQFTLHAATKKGNRPSYIRAAKPDVAIPLYEHFVKRLSEVTGKKTETGVFGADMKVALINDGPVTIWIDSKNKE
jgi:D-tyrosyl-tRNA(Tyr) deacylase